MKFGCCAEIDKAEALYKAGYDFIECTIVSLMPEENEEVFKNILYKYKDSPIPIEAFNVLLPSDLKIVGENVNNQRVKNYLSSALERVHRIGADTIVFGSGGARSLPKGFPKEKGAEQIVTFLSMVTDIAEQLNLTIVIEPLNKKESNVINSIPEAVEWTKKLNRKSLKALADFYHMEEEREPLSNLYEHKDSITHIHVADSSRFSPGTGTYPYSEFASYIHKANYDGRISIECNWRDFEEEIGQSLVYLKQQFSLV
ncbi:sugar phosphate isomerase/epimerase family protein [Niallia sp. JL1B1071]|uniref:sugar phosphate isomerase/epimerase family protein n=1 Tax=Niallia tiangongensis TaxID=3237105 RepID=UPI0037DD2BD8